MIRLLMLLIMLFVLTSCKPPAQDSCKVIMTSDGLSKEYIEMFRKFRENRNERVKYAGNIRDFLFQFNMYRADNFSKNPFILPEKAVLQLLGNPDSINNDGWWFYYIEQGKSSIKIEMHNGILINVGY
ncbi:MAG TPA: hypothetical protein DET40_23465 [Lentisphaeria bacterium]|nr:MAG: hypothetical protein A2X45_23680 [Lentisphaerae bacterium GWF2_50_93]HCE46515.1 hypothetical protein [Lentisphaeria bacterium]